MAETFSSESEEKASRRSVGHAVSEPALDTGLQASAEMPFVYSPVMLGDGRLDGRGSEPVRSAVMEKAQKTHGNRSVQRVLQSQRSAAPIAVQRTGDGNGPLLPDEEPFVPKPLPQRGEMGYVGPYKVGPGKQPKAQYDSAGNRITESEHVTARGNLEALTFNRATGQSDYGDAQYNRDATVRTPRDMALNKTHGNQGGANADNPRTAALKDRANNGQPIDYREDVFLASIENAKRARDATNATSVTDEAIHRGALHQDANLFALQTPQESGSIVRSQGSHVEDFDIVEYHGPDTSVSASSTQASTPPSTPATPVASSSSSTESATAASSPAPVVSELSKSLSEERVKQGLSPFTNSGLPGQGITPGSGAHISENLNAGGILNLIGSVGLPLVSDIGSGKDASAIGKNASKNLAGYVGGSVEGDMMSLSGMGGLGGAASTVGTLNTAAKFLGAPEEITGSVDAAMMPLSPVSSTLSEGAGAWHSILESGASAAAGDANWDKALQEHQAEGVKTASPFQPLYWAGEALSGGWDDLSRRMIGKEGRSGGMGTFVEAGNYWGDVMSEDGKFSRDMSDIGSFIWGGVSGEGGLKGGLKAGKEAISDAGSYWKNVIGGKGNLGADLNQIGDFISEKATAENALSVAEGITRKVGGDWLVGQTREASKYWGDVMSGEGQLGKDLREIGSYMWGGESGKGGIKGAASAAAGAIGDAASGVGSSIASGAGKALDWATSLW